MITIISYPPWTKLKEGPLPSVSAAKQVPRRGELDMVLTFIFFSKKCMLSKPEFAPS